MAILTLSTHLDSGAGRKNTHHSKPKVVSIEEYRGVVFVIGRPEPRRQPRPSRNPDTFDAA
jgi:hypothetical protein